MTNVARHKQWAPARVWLALALVALGLRLLAPPGYMVGRPTEAAPFPIMLCTAQGPVTIRAEAAGGDPQPDKAPMNPRHSDGPCVFAGSHHFTPPPGLIVPESVEFVRYAPRPVPALTHLAPGRGLAAPPLPARGPPRLLT